MCPLKRGKISKYIKIDPAADNKRVVRCYEKAGFVIDHTENDGVLECCIMHYPFTKGASRG